MSQKVSTVIVLIIWAFLKCNAQVADKAEDISPLLIGEKIPDGILTDNMGGKHETGTIFNKKPTVLVIFRGGWCPYCSRQLSGLVDIEEQIINMGYQIVAVSPDNYQNLVSLEEKIEARYEIYSDENGELIKKIGIAFNSGGKRGILPVPTVMVLNQEGIILFEYINPNYRVRITPELLIAVLETVI